MKTEIECQIFTELSAKDAKEDINEMFKNIAFILPNNDISQMISQSSIHNILNYISIIFNLSNL